MKDVDYRYHDPVHLSMELTGTGTNSSFDLRAFSTAIFHLTNILDNTHCVLSRQERLSKDKRNELQISATDIFRGSIHIDFDLIMAGMQMMAPVLGWVNPYSIWEYTVQSYNFLKIVGEKAKQRQKPHIQITDSPSSINVVGKDNTIIITQDVAKIASRSREGYRSMSDIMTHNGIENIHIGSKYKDDNLSCFDLSMGDTGIFTNPSIIDETPIEFRANILGFDKERLTGRLDVSLGENIPSGKYSFKLIGEQDISKYVMALSKSQVKIVGLAEKILDNISGLTIKKIHIINIFLSD